eukprot:765093-Hanusia_phi.AAC.2
MPVHTGGRGFLSWCDRFVAKYANEVSTVSQHSPSTGECFDCQDNDRGVLEFTLAYSMTGLHHEIDERKLLSSGNPRQRGRSCQRVSFANPLVQARYCPQFCCPLSELEECEFYDTIRSSRHNSADFLTQRDRDEQDFTQVIFGFIGNQARALLGMDQKGCISCREALLCTIENCLFESQKDELELVECIQQVQRSRSESVDKSEPGSDGGDSDQSRSAAAPPAGVTGTAARPGPAPAAASTAQYRRYGRYTGSRDPGGCGARPGSPPGDRTPTRQAPRRRRARGAPTRLSALAVARPGRPYS